MKKIKYLSRKLKAFTFDEIYLLAEIPKEELQEILQKLVKEDFLKKTPQGYVYCGFTQITHKSEFAVKEQQNKIVQKNHIDFDKCSTSDIKNITAAELKLIPAFNRKKYEKYTKLLKMTQGLYGKSLMLFIKEYNRLNPENKTSYPTLIRKRQLCKNNGTSALIAKYGHKGKVYYPDMEKYYPAFKDFYFAKAGISMEKARQYTAKKLNIPLNNFPCAVTFKRRLYKEFPPEVVKAVRNELCF